VTRRWWPHVVLALVGLAIVLYPFTLGRQPAVTCRDQVLSPGQVCPKAGGDGVQTYEQRAATARAARPVIVGVGVVVLGFGTYLAVTGYRRRPA
jgi:hypothetical protein